MDENHRIILQRNLVKLSESVDIESLYTSLLDKEIIFPNDLQRLKVNYPVREEQAQEFFLRYTRRGPKAFETLIESLIEIGNINQAQLLQHENTFILNQTPSSSRSLSQSPQRSPIPYRLSSSENNSPKFNIREIPKPITFGDLPPLILQVQKSIVYNNGLPIKECYPMMSQPRGFGLIINNLEFLGNPNATRYGADKDSLYLKRILELLHFQCTLCYNVGKDELLKSNGIIDIFLSQFEKKDVDCCIVAVMSHGTEGYFLTSDPQHHIRIQDNRISIYDEFLPRFNNTFSPLRYKPKIFIIQACRGDYRDRGIGFKTNTTMTDSKETTTLENSSSSTQDNNCERVPTFEDFLICQSTVPGFTANRDIERGTWYIYTLCQELAQRAHDTEFTSILKLVGRRMRSLSSEYGEKQMSSFINTGFHYDLYFNPGLFGSH